MVFASLEFLFYFLPVFLISYFVTPKKFRNYTLLVFSLLFYAVGEPIYITLMIFSSVVDYTHGRLIESKRFEQYGKWIVVSSMVINVGLLAIFKYMDFFIDSLNNLFQLDIELVNLPLPIGISFYTFQTMSYTIDVYRGRIKAQRNFIKFATYVSMFPQLIAGPIVRYSSVEENLDNRDITLSGFGEGVMRFIQGLAKKVLIADTLGYIALTASQYSDQSVLLVWLYIIGFGFQIYFDFSGYSDMAIGLGRMLGFEFPKNFNYPYISQSITEFWRRWHMTLGQWFRDYVYIPLGGNRVKQSRWLLNILIVWAITGFWHGASWNFVVWGLYFGFVLLLEKLFILDWLQKLPRVFRHMYTLLLVIIGWVLFTSNTMGDAFTMYAQLFGLSDLPFVNAYTLHLFSESIVLLLVATVLSMPVYNFIRKEKVARIWNIAWVPTMMILLLLVTAYLINESFHPFLYFRF